MSDVLLPASVPAPDEPSYEDHDWTRVDRQIVEAFGKKSIRQLAEETGVSQADLLRRKQELVDSVDALTIQMQRTKLMGTLQEIADKALADAKGSADEFRAGLYNSSVAAVKELLKQLDRIERQGSSEVETLNALRLRELLALMDRVVDLGVDDIARTFDLDRNAVLETFKGKIRIAAEEMEQR